MVLAASAAVTFAGCGSDDTPKDGPSDGDDTPAVAVVARRNITAVTTVDATIVANPRFLIRAPAKGRVVRDPKLRSGKRVRSGQPVFWQSTSSATSPVDGTFTRWLVPNHAQTARGVPIAELTYGGFAVRATIAAEDAYRLYSRIGSSRLTAKAEILNGPGPFACLPLQSPSEDSSSSSPDSTPGQGTPITCAVPSSVRAIEGVSALLAIRTAERKDVLSLPTSAVAGSAQRGQVSLRNPSTGKTRTVTIDLGITDGSVVEVKSGLRAGQVVLARAPGLAGP